MPVNTDDFSSDIHTNGTAVIGSNGFATGRIDYAGDSDWFRIDMLQGAVYQMGVGISNGINTLPTFGANNPFQMQVYNSNGTLVPNAMASMFSPSVSGTYYLSITAANSATGDYAIFIPRGLLTDDFSASTQTTGRLTTSSTSIGYIDNGQDIDWFAMQLQSGQTYALEMRANLSSSLPLLMTQIQGIYDAHGQLIANTSNAGMNAGSHINFTPEASGTYFVSAASQRGLQGEYILSLNQLQTTANPEPAANTSTQSRLSINNSVMNSIETAHDEDWFRVELTAGQTYRINLASGPNPSNQLADPLIRGLFDQQGNYIPGTYNDDFNGLNAQVTFTANTSGSYFIAAAAYGTHTGAYQLSITNQPPAPSTPPTKPPVVLPNDDITNNTNTTATLNIFNPVSSRIDTAHDSDWFRIELTGGRNYRITLNGDDNRQPTLFDPLIRGIYDQNGHYISGTFNDDFNGLNAQVDFRAPDSGIYFIAAEGYGQQTGQYTLNVEMASIALPTTNQNSNTSSNNASQLPLPSILQNQINQAIANQADDTSPGYPAIPTTLPGIQPTGIPYLAIMPTTPQLPTQPLPVTGLPTLGELLDDNSPLFPTGMQPASNITAPPYALQDAIASRIQQLFDPLMQHS